MALKDQLKRREKNNNRAYGLCKMCYVLEHIPDEDREALLEALENPYMYSVAAIRDAMLSEDYDIGITTIRTHRAGKCKGEYRGSV